MSNILDFTSLRKYQDPLQPSSDTRRKLAEIVIFPGVRYERSNETPPSPSTAGSVGSSSKSRKSKKK